MILGEANTPQLSFKVVLPFRHSFRVFLRKQMTGIFHLLMTFDFLSIFIVWGMAESSYCEGRHTFGSMHYWEYFSLMT